MFYTLSTIIFIVSFSATLPQLIQTISTGTTRDFNGWNLGLNLITNILLAVHGYLQRDSGLTAIGVWFGFYWSVLLGMKWRNMRKGDTF